MISVETRKQVVTGWTSVDMLESIDAAAVSFSLSINDPDYNMVVEKWDIVTDDELIIRIDGEPIIRGYVDTLSVSHNSASRSITISGREITSSIIDSDILDGKQYNDVDIDVFVKELVSEFGIGVKVLVPTKKIDTTIKAGENIFSTIDSVIRQQGLMLSSDGLGSLVIDRVGSKKASDRLILGENILSADSSRNHSARYSEYYVKGQAKSTDAGWGASSDSIVGKSVDLSVARKRRKVVIAEEGVKDLDIKKRSEWEAAVASARSLEGSVDVRGWVQSNGELWKKNALVFIDDKEANLFGEFLIRSVRRKLTDREMITVISPVNKESFVPKPELESEDKNTGIGWGQ